MPNIGYCLINTATFLIHGFLINLAAEWNTTVCKYFWAHKQGVVDPDPTV